MKWTVMGKVQAINFVHLVINGSWADVQTRARLAMSKVKFYRMRSKMIWTQIPIILSGMKYKYGNLLPQNILVTAYRLILDCYGTCKNIHCTELQCSRWPFMTWSCIPWTQDDDALCNRKKWMKYSIIHIGMWRYDSVMVNTHEQREYITG